MKNNIKNSMRASVLIAAFALTFAACSDWTEYESLDVKTPSLEEQNPELYAAYLQNLRTYKAGAHKVIFVTFANVATTPAKQSEHLIVVPDSVDYISLNKPDALHATIIEEMSRVREKGTKVIYNVDFPAIESEWALLVKKDPTLTEAQALAYITQRTDEMFALCDKYGYDGVTISYPGRSLVSLPPAGLALYGARQQTFFARALAWRETHLSKAFTFIGNAQFLIDENKTILQQCDYLILTTDMVANASDITVSALTAVGSGNVPSDRFIVATQTPRPDDKDMLYGYFGSLDADGNKVRSIIGSAEWVGQPSAFTRAGMLIRNAQFDYFNQTLTYRYIREAAGIMNPSPKN